ncbi:MAG: ATP-dependent helicase HrpB [Syntrophotaleaceae bacterium]
MTLSFPPLPIDPLLPDLRQALADHNAVVLQAEPGAGKTTRVPLALMAQSWLAGQRIWMLEPRRLAAAHAARYMARLLGEPVGERVGYAIRFERRVSPRTRVEVITEGLLTRRLQNDPLLEGVGLVIFDEFHERNLHSDLALALCRDIQQGLREDLRLLVMSATLDAEPVSDLLGGAPLLTSRGRSFPVAVRYLEREPQGRLADYTTGAILRTLADSEGDLLVFLPGVGDIRRCQEQLQGTVAEGETLICPLYGDLPFDDQQKALRPADRRKIVLATNIAETSLTIEGVRVVIDSGFMRRPRFDPASGLERLETVRISRANAEQRAGRAGRLAPGICLRLWPEARQGELLSFSPAEIRSADLTGLVLELARWGTPDAHQLAWLDPPAEGVLKQGRDLLVLLGALDEAGRITPAGETMAALPIHPRLAALLRAGERLGQVGLACDLAALLSERDPLAGREQAPHRTRCDLLERLELLDDWRSGRTNSAAGGKAESLRPVERAARYWREQLGAENAGSSRPADEDMVGRLLAAAYPDRIGRKRAGTLDRYHFSGGQGGRISPRSGVGEADFLVAVTMSGGDRGDGSIQTACSLTPDIIEQEFGPRLVWDRRVEWDREQERVVAREERKLGALILTVRPVIAGSGESLAALLTGLRLLGLETLGWSDASRQVANRIKFLARTFPEQDWPDCSEEAILADVENWLAPFLAGARSRADLELIDPLPALLGRLDWRQQRRLEELAPTRLKVPSGHFCNLSYPGQGAPVLAVKLQELFGLAETPRVAGGRVPVLIHLLSPARRPVAVTADLQSFWQQGYPEVRKELAGRYPKHPWPQDPWKALPTRFVKRRN